VAPLGYAVRLVDREQADAEAVHAAPEVHAAEALGRDVEQLGLAARAALEPLFHLSGPERRVDERGRHAPALERVDLVLHERDERADDDGEPRQHERGDLVAETLSAAGGHEHQHVAAREHRADCFRLHAAEVRVAEQAAQLGAGALVERVG